MVARAVRYKPVSTSNSLTGAGLQGKIINNRLFCEFAPGFRTKRPLRAPKMKGPPTEAALLFIAPSTQEEHLARPAFRSRLRLNIG